MTETRVGHWTRDDVDTYAGRGKNGRNMLDTPVGKRGWLGNPFSLEKHTREDSIDKFRKVFEDKLDRDDEFREAVKDLSGKTLGCWCQDLDKDSPACHASVIADKADELINDD